jgi:hypothetical protein
MTTALGLPQDLICLRHEILHQALVEELSTVGPRVFFELPSVDHLAEQRFPGNEREHVNHSVFLPVLWPGLLDFILPSLATRK